MQFWFANNLRVDQVRAPTMTSCGATVSGSTVTVTGAALDPAGAVSSYHVTLEGPALIDDAAAGSGSHFDKRYFALARGTYAGIVKAADSGTGQTSAACHLQPLTVN